MLPRELSKYGTIVNCTIITQSSKAQLWFQIYLKSLLSQMKKVHQSITMLLKKRYANFKNDLRKNIFLYQSKWLHVFSEFIFCGCWTASWKTGVKRSKQLSWRQIFISFFICVKYMISRNHVLTFTVIYCFIVCKLLVLHGLSILKNYKKKHARELFLQNRTHKISCRDVVSSGTYTGI